LILVYLSVAWMVGIFLAAHVDLPLRLWGLACLLPLSGAWLWRCRSGLLLASLCILSLLLGAARYTAAIPHLGEHDVAAYNDQGLVTLVGVVAGEPDVRDTYANLRLRAETLTPEAGLPRAVRGIVLVRVSRYPERFYGDRLQVRGQLDTPPVLESFSYRDYLARQGIYSLVRWARVETLERGQGSRLIAGLLVFKRRAQQVIAAVLPEPCAALLTGILLGEEGGLPRDLSAAFDTTGTSHIIAISGFNIAIVSGVISSMSVRLIGRRYAAWFATAAIAGYTAFVGGSAAVVRAALMGCIAAWGQHLGRQNSVPNALFGSALFMTAWNPHTLWDLGFLLSFAATLGLVTLAEPFGRAFERLLARLLPARWVEGAAKLLNESLILTTCAQLTTIPIIVYNFGTLSLVTLLSNVLILPPQPQVMLWGALATAAGLAWLPLGRILGWIAWLFLAYTIWVVEWTAKVPYAAVELGRISPAWVWAWYAALGGGVWWLSLREERRSAIWRSVVDRLPVKMLAGGLGVVGVLTWLAVVSLPDGKLHVTFFDGGEGQATLVETPSGRQVLVDGGSSSNQMLAHLGRRMPFWDRSLDAVVLTGSEDERLLGLIPVLERYRVDHVLAPDLETCVSSTCARWRELLRENEVAPQPPMAGVQVDLGDGVRVTVLHPDGEALADAGTADRGAALRIDYRNACFLLASSTNKEARAAMLARGENTRCDVLQVGRQDAQEALTPAFLEAVYPALTIISCGEDQQARAVDQQTLDQLGHYGETLCADRYGAIEVTSDGTEYRVKVRQ
jgi:competence protein ComEC